MPACSGCSRAPGQTSFTRQQVPLGLGHAVWCARDLVGDEPFALLLPDMIMQSEKGCMKDMVELYDETGNNIIAVQECDPAEAAQIRHRRPGEDTHHGFRITGMVEKPKHGHGAVQPLHQRPLHPAAGDLRASSKTRSAAPATRSSSPTRC